MKFVLILCAFALASVSASFSTSNEASFYERYVAQKYKGINLKPIIGNPKKGSNNRPNTIASVTKSNWMILDTVANSLSYLNDKQQPFVFEPVTNSLIAVQRGSFDNGQFGPNSNNPKNNLYMRKSKDYGLNWEPKVLLYNEIDFQLGQVRFPSAYAYADKAKNVQLAITFPLIIEATPEWKGAATGLYGSLNGTPVNIYLDNIGPSVNGINYKWGGYFFDSSSTNPRPSWSYSDSKIVSWEDSEGSNYILATGGIMPLPEGDFNNNSNFGIRRYKNIDEDQKFYIPEQWSQSRFEKVTGNDTRSNEQIGLQLLKNGHIYFGVFGNFVNTNPLGDAQRNEVGVSKSTDGGLTWSEFDIFPFQKIRDYLPSGMPTAIASEVSMIFYSKSLVVQDNGDWSVFTVLGEYSDDTQKIPGDKVAQIVELAKVGGEYKVRKIADIPRYPPFLLNAEDRPVGSSMDFEIQAARTEDGNNIIVKWIEGENTVINADDTYTHRGTNIYVAAKATTSEKWSPKADITQTLDSNNYKATWLPNFLNNDISRIPMLYLQGLSGVDSRKYLSQQIVAYGTFNGNEVLTTSVEENINTENQISIAPNPVQENTTVRFFADAYQEIEVKIIDMIGNVIEVRKVNTLSGFNNLELDTRVYPAGNYLVSFVINGKAFNERFTVVK